MNDPDLSTLLSDPEQGGVYEVDAVRGEALRAAAEALRYVVVEIDFDRCRDKGAALARIATAMRFPGWFGDNWDALADCLGDLSWLPGPGYVLLLANTQDWRRGNAEDFDTLVEIADDASRDWGERGVPFWLLVLADDEDRDATD